MSIKPLHASVCGLALAIAAAATPAAAECKFAKLVDLPVTIEGWRAVAEVKINGKPAKVFIDTGAAFSALNGKAVEEFGLKWSPVPLGLQVNSIGGVSRDAKAVRADNFEFAGAGFHNLEFLLLNRAGENGISGAVGENILGPFDVEYDLGAGVVRIFKADGCGNANLAYWAKDKPASRLDLDKPGRYLTQIITRAEIDGHPIRVTLDSGAPLSTLSRSGASRSGVQIATEGVVSAGVSSGVQGGSYEEYLAPFASFKIGDEEIRNTKLRFGDLRLGDSDMLLGLDFFLSHRILVSSSQAKLYFTYNGGPVFRLDQAPVRQPRRPGAQMAAVEPGTPTPTATIRTDTGDTPKTAEEFARRASALATRREFGRAVADYTQAIGLDPDNGAYYRARAMARLGARQPVLAMADFDESLKRKPDDPEALMRRGELYLATRDPARAKADFEAAMKLEPQNDRWITEAAGAYARAGLYEPAIQQLDAWITAHPRGDELGRSLLARCYARAAWGKDLDMALADCDASLRRDKNSLGLRTKGLVLLRMGRTDEAIVQYAAAIKAQPHDAAALYGRGLAELKKGQKTESDADFAAARAVAPRIDEEFKRMGLGDAAGAAATPAAAG